MPRLTGEAFTNATQTVPVTFLAGREGGALQIPKGLLQHWSEPLAELAEANDGLIRLADEELATVRAFHHWILKDHLPPIMKIRDSEEHMERNKTFVNLWLFGSRYAIPTLQDVTIHRLALLFENPHHMEKRTLVYIWKKTSSPTSPLRTLAAFVAARQVKERMWKTAQNWEHFDNLQMKLPGLMVKLLAAVDEWTEFQAPKRTKADKRSRWMLFYEQLVENGLMAIHVEAPEDDPVPIPDDEEPMENVQ